MQSLALPKEVLEAFKFHFIAGWSGFPLVGTPEQIVDKLLMLRRAGQDADAASGLAEYGDISRVTAQR